jgi:polyhydroxyalkanoate synthesis regulator protein
VAEPDRVLIKRYGDGRLYNTKSGIFVSLTDLADMLVNGERIIAEDAETGDNITGNVLDLIIQPNLRDGRK